MNKAEIIKRCKASTTWFLRNFGKLKHPSAGVLRFNPFSYQRKSIKAFKTHRFNIFRKCRQCFAGSSMVWGPYGPRPIDSIKAGDEVYSYDFKSGSLVISEVEEVFENGECELHKISGNGGHRALVTGEHVYMTKSGQKRVADMYHEDELIYVADIYGNVSVDLDIAAMLGIYIIHGDGNVIKTNFRFKAEIFNEYCNAIYGSGSGTYYSDGAWCVDVPDGFINDFVYIDDGLISLRECVFEWDRRSTMALLGSALGSMTCRGGPDLAPLSGSTLLLHQIKQLMSRANIRCTVHDDSISVASSNDDGIDDVDDLGVVERVYDLSVPPHHNYIVDGVVVHNSGISKISGAFALWFGMFHNHKTILIISRRNEDAMEFLRDHVTFLFEHLPAWMRDIWKPVKQNEHEIHFPNGSTIRSLTSHKDVLRSHASSLNIIDEAAFIQDMDAMWAGGWSCVTGDTLVHTVSGMFRIDELVSDRCEWTDIGVLVKTDTGYSTADKGYYNGEADIVSITSNLGLTFSGTMRHKVRVISDGAYVWRELDDIKIGDWVVVATKSHSGIDMHIDGYGKITGCFAELIGLYYSRGVICGNTITIRLCPNITKAYISGLVEGADLAVGVRGDEKHAEITCQWLAESLSSGELSCSDRIPIAILNSSTPVLQAFLRGIMCLGRKSHGSADVCGFNDKFAKQIHMAMISVGAIAEYVDGSISIDDVGMLYGDLPDAAVECEQLINGFECAASEYDSICDMIADNGGEITYGLVRSANAIQRLDDTLSWLVRNNLIVDKVVDITHDTAVTYDLSVPDCNTYVANCFVSHNTLQHGGNVIVISTTAGVGGWYWATYTDAEAGVNQFNPIMINWWDMDWAIEYIDPLTHKKTRIAPRDGIRKCKTKEEIEKYGPYWSPWLEEQWRALQERGETWKFEQEILARFVGSGNTVVDRRVLAYIQTTVRGPVKKITSDVEYEHPVSGRRERVSFDFDGDEGFYIWKKPASKSRGARSNHSYVMGVDIATGKGRDYSAIEVFDIDEMEQVAEFMARCIPRDLVKYVDFIGRLYNNALAVIERNNGGDIVIDSLRLDYLYPRIWRKKLINDTPKPMTSKSGTRPLKVRPYGFATTNTSKQVLNKYLIDCIRDNSDDGYTIYSDRLLKQLQTYVRKRDRAGRDTDKTEAEDGAGNFDDLVIATALALMGAMDALSVSDDTGLLIYNIRDDGGIAGGKVMSQERAEKLQQELSAKTGSMAVVPITTTSAGEWVDDSIEQQINEFAAQLGGIVVSRDGTMVTLKKHFYTVD